MSARRRLSAAGRVAAALVAVLTVGVLLVAGIAYASVARAVSNDIDQALLHESEAYAAAIAPVGTDDTRTLVEASRAYLAARTGTGGASGHVLLLRFADGRVLSNSDLKLENAPGNDALLDPATTKRGYANLEFEGDSYRALVAPVSNTAGDVVAVFEAATPVAPFAGLERQLLVALLLACLSAVIIGGAISLFMARRALGPLRRMAESAGTVTHASLGGRVSYEGPPDELGTLADALNAMLDRLEAAFSEQRRFVADASHELRTPVAIVRGSLEILQQPWADEAERAEALRVIDDEIARMQRLIDDMLSLARTQAPSRRPFQPLEATTLLAEVVAKARTLGEREIDSVRGEPLWIEGDPDLLEQALLNIVRNAFDHTAPGDRITATCTRAGDRVRFTISDSGPGIREEDLPRVFDRFFRAGGARPGEGGGSGLGLAITARLIELHGGTISTANGEDGGAAFTVDLPRIEPPADA